MLLQIIQYTTNFETKLEKRFNNKVSFRRKKYYIIL